ncbi:glycosyltransferase [soil metagenome]
MLPAAIVVIPAYNADATLAAAVLSLFPAKTAFDILVIDDGSKVPVKKVLDACRGLEPYRQHITIIRSDPNQGLVPSLNKGVALAIERGHKYVIRMDADDLARPGRIDRQIAFMDAHPDVAVSGFQLMLFKHARGDYGERRFPLSQDDIRRRMCYSGGFSHPSLIIRTGTFKRVGLYDARYLHAEDFDWTWRCMRVVKMVNLPDFLLDYRVSENQVSAKHRHAQLRAKMRVLLRELMRGEAGCLAGLLMTSAVFMLPFHASLIIKDSLKRVVARA